MSYSVFEEQTLTCMHCGVTARVRIMTFDSTADRPSERVYPQCAACGAIEWMDLPLLEDPIDVQTPAQVDLVETPWGTMTREQIKHQARAWLSWQDALRQAMRELDE